MRTAPATATTASGQCRLSLASASETFIYSRSDRQVAVCPGVNSRRAAKTKNDDALMKKNETAKFRITRTTSGRFGWARKSQFPSSHPFPQKGKCNE